MENHNDFNRLNLEERILADQLPDISLEPALFDGEYMANASSVDLVQILLFDISTGQSNFNGFVTAAIFTSMRQKVKDIIRRTRLLLTQTRPESLSRYNRFKEMSSSHFYARRLSRNRLFAQLSLNDIMVFLYYYHEKGTNLSFVLDTLLHIG